MGTDGTPTGIASVAGGFGPRLTVMILGGYGTFGGRLARLLADEPRLTLLIAGRSASKAERFCDAERGRAAMLPTVADRDDVGPVLARTRPDIVVDATGPFQSYGPDPYRVAEACLSHGAHYLDLADGSDFVEGISGLDAPARERGVWALSGVSSFPVLTVAVVDELARDMDEVDGVAAGIAPSPWAVVGTNVIRAIAAYAGKPVSLRRDGADRAAYALTESRDYAVAPPGALPSRRGASRSSTCRTYASSRGGSRASGTSGRAPAPSPNPCTWPSTGCRGWCVCGCSRPSPSWRPPSTGRPASCGGASTGAACSCASPDAGTGSPSNVPGTLWPRRTKAR